MFKRIRSRLCLSFCLTILIANFALAIDALSNAPVEITPDTPFKEKVFPTTDPLERVARKFLDKQDEPEPEALKAQSADQGHSDVIDAFESRLLGRTHTAPVGADKGGAAQPATAPLGGLDWLLRTVAALAAVLGLILLCRAVMIRFTGRVVATGRNSAVELLSRLNVSPRNHILLVRIGGRILVLGESPAGLDTLAEVQDSEEVADLLQSVTSTKSGSVTHSFSQLLHRFNGEYSDAQRIEQEGADGQEYDIDRTRDQVTGLVGRIRALTGKGGH